jgi:hypothetical protein
LKEQDAAGGGATELSAPPDENKFHIKLKFSPKLILILIQCQIRRIMRMLCAIKYWEPCIWSFFCWLRDFLLLLRVPYRLPSRQFTVKEKISLVLGFTLYLRDQTLKTLA